MRPPSAGSGSKAWVRKNTPLTCTAKSASHCASVVDAKSATPSTSAMPVRDPYSALIPPRWITAVHLATSSRIRCANSAGVLPTG